MFYLGYNERQLYDIIIFFNTVHKHQQTIWHFSQYHEIFWVSGKIFDISAVSKIRKKISGLMYKLLLSFMIISDLCRSII